jgi:hypothetical protein
MHLCGDLRRSREACAVERRDLINVRRASTIAADGTGRAAQAEPSAFAGMMDGF